MVAFGLGLVLLGLVLGAVLYRWFWNRQVGEVLAGAGWRWPDRPDGKARLVPPNGPKRWTLAASWRVLPWMITADEALVYWADEADELKAAAPHD